MPIGDKIKQLRAEKRWGQNELAEKISSDARQISRYEKGRITPSTEVVLKLAEVFDVSTDYLLRDEAIKRPLTEENRDVVERLQQINALTAKDREALLHILDALLAKNRFRSIADELDQAEKVAG